MKRKFAYTPPAKGLRHLNTYQKHTDRSGLFIVSAGVLAYTIIMSVLCILRYESFTASVYDLGIMIQTVWNTANGYWLQDSVNMGYPMMRFWMAHWEFIYLPLALIYKIFSTPYSILILHTFVIAIGAIPVYWLAKEKLTDEITAIVFAFSYLMYPAIQNGNLTDVHGLTFAAPFLLFTFYFLQKKSYGLFSLFALLAILSREDSALLLFMMGIYSFFIMKNKKSGIAISIISILWFVIWYKRMTIRSMLGLPEFVIMEGAETHWSHLAAIADDPLYLIKFLAKKYNILYFFNLFAPLFFLSVFSPATLLIAAPVFAINLLSSYYYTHGVDHYYSATIAPFIYISAIYGTRKVIDLVQVNLRDEKKLWFISTIVGFLTLFFFFSASRVFEVKEWKITDHHRTIKSIIREIPEQASVTATRKIAVHLSERHELYLFNEHVDKVDYIVYDFYAPTVRLLSRASFVLPYYWPDNDSIRKVLKNEDYGIVEYEDGVCLFKKGADHEQGLKLLAHSNGRDIVNKQQARIDNRLLFKGYNTHDILKYYVQPDKLGKISWKKALHVTCFWQTMKDTTSNFEITFKMQSAKNEYGFEHEPVFGVYPGSRWNSEQTIRDEVFWELPDELPGGVYTISAAIKEDKQETEFIKLFDFKIEN